MLNEIAQIVKDLVGSDNLYFDEGLIIKTSPHTLPFIFWGVAAVGDTVYIMDGSESWTQLDEKDVVIVNSLYQRISIINQTYKQVS